MINLYLNTSIFYIYLHSCYSNSNIHYSITFTAFMFVTFCCQKLLNKPLHVQVLSIRSAELVFGPAHLMDLSKTEPNIIITVSINNILSQTYKIFQTVAEITKKYLFSCIYFFLRKVTRPLVVDFIGLDQSLCGEIIS